MSRYITKYMNIEKSKRPIFWNGGSSYKIGVYCNRQGASIYCEFVILLSG